MPPVKKSAPKLLTKKRDNFLTDSEFINGSLKRKPENGQQADTVSIEESNLSNTNPTVVKKTKINESIEACGQLRQKTLNVMNPQLDARKQVNEKMLEKFSDTVENFQADYDVLKENVQKLGHLSEALLKSMKQSSIAYKQKLKLFKELHATYKKRYEDMYIEQRAQVDKLGGELEEDVSKLKLKLISETKRSEWKKLQKYFMKDMQYNF
ncbi:uncharacterized protein [Maniola hyperantus]|uniref:uncharacterized protein n=1 Tax=Aphantopus hyperantus TaxID=2795564 RepID=UPI0015688E6E|nr:uncharacterized protein LOC117987717 [Maniola hyperantus]